MARDLLKWATPSSGASSGLRPALAIPRRGFSFLSEVPAPDPPSVCFTLAAAEAEAHEADCNKGQHSRLRNRNADTCRQLTVENLGVSGVQW